MPKVQKKLRTTYGSPNKLNKHLTKNRLKPTEVPKIQELSLNPNPTAQNQTNTSKLAKPISK